jgi:hypothetical protein
MGHQIAGRDMTDGGQRGKSNKEGLFGWQVVVVYVTLTIAVFVFAAHSGGWCRDRCGTIW